MLTHRNILSNVEGIYRELKFDDNDRFLSFLPLSHIFERMGGHFTTFSMGCSVYYAESIDTVADNLAEVSPTGVLSVPRLYEKMYSRIIEGLKTAPSIRRKLFYWAISVGKDVLLYNSNQSGVSPSSSYKTVPLVDTISLICMVCPRTNPNKNIIYNFFIINQINIILLIFLQ